AIVHVQPVPDAVRGTSGVGMVSVTEVARVVAAPPTFWIVSIHCALTPSWNRPLCVFVSARSTAPETVTVSVALLLALLESGGGPTGAETLAVFVICPLADAETLTIRVIAGRAVPGATSVGLVQVTVPEALAHVQPVPD